MNDYDPNSEVRFLVRCVAGAAVAILLVFVAWLVINPRYRVYSQALAGEAALREAESSRQIAVEEARAKMKSAKMLAQAEIERAKGVAEANKIIGDSLQGNDDYLRYLWITSLDSGSAPTVIYVPTEAGLPITEAGKRPQNAADRAGF